MGNYETAKDFAYKCDMARSDPEVRQLVQKVSSVIHSSNVVVLCIIYDMKLLALHNIYLAYAPETGSIICVPD